MKKSILLLLVIPAMIFAVGCDENNDKIVTVDTRPEPPQGVFTVTGNNAVYVYWTGPYESDIKEYIIKRSLDEFTGYQEIGRRTAVSNPDRDLIYYDPGYVDQTAQNGVTYFYAVSSVDKANQESELSAESVFDTPRPEGNVDLYDMAYDATRSGFSLANAVRVDFDSPLADIYVDKFDGILYLNAANINTDIQDMGFHDSFDEVGWAPADGWSQLGYFEVIEGHIYVIWTDDLHFAKVQVLGVGANAVSLAWAYQTSTSDLGNQELAPRHKPVHGPEYLVKTSNIAVSSR